MMKRMNSWFPVLLVISTLWVGACEEKDLPEPKEEDKTEEKETEEEETDSEPEVEPEDIEDATFYKAPTTFGVTKNLVTDYGVDNTDKQDDSQKLQTAIDEISSQENGGKLIIPAGNYYLLSVHLKSNVHIEIDENAVIFPTFLADGRNHRVFEVGTADAPGLENVSIVGTGEGFTVDFRETTDVNLAVFSLGLVTNFKLSNFSIEDNETIFASILISLARHGSYYSWPKNGIIENIKSYHANSGYGLVQTYAADNILFRDVHAQGGVTLRFETDNLTMKEVGKGGIRDIYGENVSAEDGLAAVMFSPHFMENGAVQIKGVHSKNCTVAVRVEEGFVEIFGEVGESKDAVISRVQALIGVGSVDVTYLRGQGGTRWAVRLKNEFAEVAYEKTGLKPGSFAPSNVFDVTAEYGMTAQQKHPFLPYLSCDERDEVCRPGETGSLYYGPSVAAVYDNNTDVEFGSYQVNVHQVDIVGFPDTSNATIKFDTPTSGCPNISWPSCD